MNSFKFIIQDLNDFTIRVDLEDLVAHWIRTNKMTPEDAYSFMQYARYLMSKRDEGDSKK